MELKYVLIPLIALLDLGYFMSLFRDIRKNRESEPSPSAKANPVLLALYMTVRFFLSTLGIPDTAICSAVYLKFRLVETRKFFGTLLAQSILPVSLMALGYLSFVGVSPVTLLVIVLSCWAGNCVGPRIAFLLPDRGIKTCISIGLFLAGLMMLLSKAGVLPRSGDLMALGGWRLAAAAVICFIAGVMNTIGIGSFSIMLSSLYALGLNQLAVYPIMMSACALGNPFSGTQFIRQHAYDAKLALIGNIFGSIGAILAIYAVRRIDISVLQWIVIGIVFYSSAMTVRGLLVQKKQAA